LLDKVAKFKEYQTTYSEIVKELGAPKAITTTNGVKVATYSDVETHNNAATYIPVVGLFAGKATIKGGTAYLAFDKNDILIMKKYPASTIKPKPSPLPMP